MSKPVQVLIVFDSRRGHTLRLALAVAEGVKEVGGCAPVARRVELDAPESSVARDARYHETRRQLEPIAVCGAQELREASAIITGSPSHFGGMTHNLRRFWESTAVHWAHGDLRGRVGAAFCSAEDPASGVETALMAQLLPMMQHGMLIFCPGYADTMRFGAASPYGAASLRGRGGREGPTEPEERAAHELGRQVAQVARTLHAVAVGV